jgi:GNAT superfamily N-acetyltransferase
MAEDARATLLVAEEEGQIVGFLYATIEKALPIFLHDEFALIREWWVEPPFRTRGVGKALLKHAAAEFTRVCVRQVRVRTSVADQDVRATIQRCGFRPGPRDMVMDLRPTS